MIQFTSTLGNTPQVDLESAVLQGRAPDGGLYVPTELPKISEDQLNEWKSLSYPQLAFQVLSLFIHEKCVPANDLRELVNSSFATFGHPEVIPHHTFSDGTIVQELFHGPTLSFKDVAMGFVVNLFDYFLNRRGEEKTLMVATSGDTGPAAAFASIGKSSLSTWVFFPEGLITDEQARQMTTILARNVHPVSVAGCRNGSDDLDDLISGCFQDEAFRTEMSLSSVNSINWARVMTQLVHYFHGYLQNVKQVGEPVHFSVPCGAFGNMCAGTIARRMGLPIGQMIAASNANGILARTLETGVFAKHDIQNTLASAIDIAVPMNFWRHVYFSWNGDATQTRHAFEQYEATGSVSFSTEQHSLIRHNIMQRIVDDSEILNSIKCTWLDDGYLLDPHGAVAVSAARHYKELLNSGPIVCLATAHPAKFPETTQRALGEFPQQGKHPSLDAAMNNCERKYHCHFETMATSVRKAMRAMRKVS